MKLTKSEKAKLARHGLSGLNKPKMTPGHPSKKAVVATRVDGKLKIIRFGAQGYGHNYSPEARRAFKTRHAKNIARGRSSAAYWADRFLWAGSGGSVRKPPKPRRGSSTRRAIQKKRR